VTAFTSRGSTASSLSIAWIFPSPSKPTATTQTISSSRGSTEDTARAVEHLLFAVVEIAGRAVDAIIDREFDYQFTSVADLLLTARRFPEVQRYLDESDFLGLLLKLAAALDETDTPGAPVAAAGIRRDIQAALSLQR
jgi:hypothetical protein